MFLGFPATTYVFEGGIAPMPLGYWLVILEKVSELEKCKKRGMLSSGNFEDNAECERSIPLWKKCHAPIRVSVECSVGLRVWKPDGKSGFWFSGVMGPDEGVKFRILQADLKFSSVGAFRF